MTYTERIGGCPNKVNTIQAAKQIFLSPKQSKGKMLHTQGIKITWQRVRRNHAKLDYILQREGVTDRTCCSAFSASKIPNLVSLSHKNGAIFHVCIWANSVFCGFGAQTIMLIEIILTVKL